MTTQSNECGFYRGPADALLAMVERGCPKFLKAGGGPIIKDYPGRYKTARVARAKAGKKAA